jgi:hypothetical protein
MDYEALFFALVPHPQSEPHPVFGEKDRTFFQTIDAI